MRKFVKSIPLFVGLALLPAGGALAAQGQSGQAQQPNSLQQLLDQVQADLRQQTAQDQQRLQKFMQARDRQQALLQEAKQALAQENARTNKLQAQFDANEKTLSDLSTTLQSREGNLGEVFGIVRQTAGEFKSSLDNSIISSQYPNRGVFAAKLAASQALPSIHDLKTLWYDMLEEMVEQGQVVKFPSSVTLLNGSKKQGEVVRIGSYNTIMGGQYLEYQPSSNSLVVAPRQPGGGSNSSAGHLARSSGDSLVGFGLDPLHGQLLSLYVQKPTFPQRVEEGGAVGNTILVLFGIALLVCIERLIYLVIIRRKVRRQLKSSSPSPNNPLGRVLSVYDENRKDDVETLTLKLDEAIMKEVPAIEARQGFIKLIAAIGPLLGLLGTVIGMVQTFTAITLFGAGNPAFMAQGISYALVTTVEGLVTAIPLVFLHSFIQGMSRNIVQILEEQTAGILAEQAEKANR